MASAMLGLWERLRGQTFWSGDAAADGSASGQASTAEARLRETYELHEELGKGAYGSVVRGVHRGTGAEVAIKIIPKGVKEREDEDQRLANEVDILRRVKHENLVSLHDVYDTPDTLYLVMQLCRGGELFDRIVAKKKFSEEEARSLVKCLLSAIAYLHERGIVHRDLKPENVLMVSDDLDDDRVAITDFGLAKFNSDEETQMQTLCGSPSYIAPEVLALTGYTKACDLWSIGVILYILLCGFPPFYATDNMKLFTKIRDGKWGFLSPWWDPVSDSAKDLVRKLICNDPAKRLTAEQALARDPRPGLADELAKERDSRMRLKASLVSTRAVVRMKLAALSVFSQHGRGSAAVRDVAGGGGGGGDGKASDGDAGEGSASHEHRVRKRGRGAAVADGFVTASNSVVPGKKSSKATGAAGNAGAGERQRSTRSRRTRS